MFVENLCVESWLDILIAYTLHKMNCDSVENVTTRYRDATSYLLWRAYRNELKSIYNNNWFDLDNTNNYGRYLSPINLLSYWYQTTATWWLHAVARRTRGIFFSRHRKKKKKFIRKPNRRETFYRNHSAYNRDDVESREEWCSTRDQNFFLVV